METPTFIVNAGVQITEPGDLFSAQLDEQLAAWVPNRIEADGATLYRLGERQISRAMQSEQDSVFDASTHLEYMIGDGVDAEVAFPTLGLLVSRVGHPEAARRASALYNEWILDAVSGLRHTIVPVAVLPMTRLSQATEALETVIDLEFSSVIMPCALLETCEDLTDPAWDPFFARAAEAQMTLVFHTGAGNVHHRVGRNGGGAAFTATRRTTDAISTLAALLDGGLLHRHPRCRVAFAGGGASWLAGVCERLDHACVGSRDAGLDRLPSEIVSEQVHCLFDQETSFVANLDRLPASCFAFAAGSVADGLAGRARSALDRHSALDEQQRAALLGGTGAMLFGTSAAQVADERSRRPS